MTSRSMSLFYALLFVFIQQSMLLHAQSKTDYSLSSRVKNIFNFEHFTTRQGLSQNSIYTILQDTKGFLWFGTQDGLNRFNGYEFTVFRHNSFDSTSICHSFINKLYEDSKERFWVCTEGGLALYNPLTETFTNYIHDEKDPQSITSNYVWTILEDRNGMFWVGTKRGLSIFDPEKQTLKPINVTANNNSKTPINVSTIVEDKAGNLWIGTRGKGLFRIGSGKNNSYDRSNASVKHYDVGSGDVRAIFENSYGNLWIGTFRSGLFKFNPSQDSFDPISMNGTSRIHSDYEAIITISSDPTEKDKLWLGTEEDGIIIYDIKQNGSSKIINDPLSANSLSGNMVQAICRDWTGVIWVGTNEGINKLNLNANKFVHIDRNGKNKSGLNSDAIGKIIEDCEGKLWIGSDGGGIVKFDLNSNKFTSFMHNRNNPTSLSSNRAMIVTEDHNGTMWVGTFGGGLNKLNKQNGSFESFTFDKSDSTSIGSNYITSIVEDKSGYLWTGTTTGGVYRFDPKTKIFTRFMNDPEDPESISGNHVWILFLDSKGTLWAGTKSGGLNEMTNMTIGKFKSYQHDHKIVTGINHNSVHTIFEDHSGKFWIGTPGGLNLLDRQTGKFVTFNQMKFFSQFRIIGILEDNHNRLWLMTEKALVRFDPLTDEIKFYDKGNGMMINDFRIWANYKNRKGEMFVGGANGFAIFYPDSLKDNTFIPPIVIDKFERYNSDNAYGNAIIEKGIPYRKNISLSYKDNIFSFSFSALNFINSERNQYAYKLEGFNNEWIYIGTQQKVTFTNLDPGSYTFIVKGSNDEGLWNEAGTSIAFSITPPFWGSWWFRVVGFLTIVLTLYLMRRKKLAAVEKHHKEQEAFARQLIETEEGERQRIANELHDSLGQNLLVIKNILLVKMQKAQIEGKSLSDTSELVSQTLQEVRSISHNLRPHQLDQLGITKTIKSLVNQLNDSTEINITAKIDDIKDVLDTKAEISLFRIIQECFNNIIKHSHAKNANILIQHLPEFIKVSVKDDGKGIDQLEMKKLEELGHGFGLYGMKSRAHVFDWIYEIHSAPNKGTVITLLIPLKRLK